MCSTKTSLMLGLGETEEEILETMDDLRAIGVDILTLGQYLRPTPNHLPVERYVTPEEFNRYREIGLEKGFMEVPSGLWSAPATGLTGSSIKTILVSPCPRFPKPPMPCRFRWKPSTENVHADTAAKCPPEVQILVAEYCRFCSGLEVMQDCRAHRPVATGL